MKSERILSALTLVDEKYITEAVPDNASAKKKIRAVKWVRPAAACAAVVILTLTGMHLIKQSDQISCQNEDDIKRELPILTIGENTSGGMGFEGYMAYDISELVNGNPWSEDADITELPVFRNRLEFGEYRRVINADITSMTELLLEVAKRLGMDTENLPVTDNTPSKDEQEAILLRNGGYVPEGYFDPTRVMIEDENYKVTVDYSMSADIDFKTPVSLPDDISFMHHSSYEEMSEAAEYLKNEYAWLISMDDIRTDIHGGDYDIDRNQGYHIYFYEGGDSVEEDIISYNFAETAFYCNSDGELDLVRIYAYDLSEKVGDYPIISPAEAKELLMSGNYITNAPSEFPGEDSIAKVELVYRNGMYDEYYMPYYRFYIEIPEGILYMGEDDGLKNYGAYYVPAVQSEYISDMPLWDGSFN